MKKVLAIAPYPYLPFFSGGQKLVAQFLDHLGSQVELTVISVGENDVSLAKTYKIIPLLKRSFSRYFDRSLVSKISSLIKKEGFDTVIWEHPYYAWLAFRVRKRTGVTTIIHTHNIEYQRFRSTGKWWWPVLKIYEKQSFKKADWLFFITKEDREFAIHNWKVKKEKCIDLPFGIELKNYPVDRTDCRNSITQQHGIAPGEKIILFNGLLNYKPNLEALSVILYKINPLLLAQTSFLYKIIICGKGLPGEFNKLKGFTGRNIIYAGFVNDIAVYFKAADLFLNPVQSGGGIKTKMVEAIAYGATVIATKTGATGIEKELCGNKLIVIEDNDWNSFARSIVSNETNSSLTPSGFYDYYYWENIVQKMIAIVNGAANTA